MTCGEEPAPFGSRRGCWGQPAVRPRPSLAQIWSLLPLCSLRCPLRLDRPARGRHPPLDSASRAEPFWEVSSTAVPRRTSDDMVDSAVSAWWASARSLSRAGCW